MLFERPEKRQQLLSAGNLLAALAVHVALFGVLWLFAAFHGFFDKKEEIIPIDLTVVVNENLDGVENEPPPLQKLEPQKPEPPKPKPKPQPKPKEPEKPKELEKIVTNIVTKVEKKDEKPKEEVKKPEPPKKTAEQIKKEKEEARKKRLEEIRNRGKVVKTPVTIEVKNAPSGNGRTDRKTLSDAEIKRLLNAGYKPGVSTQLAANEEQLGYSLIKAAFETKWDEPPWTDTLRPMVIRVWFGPGGRIVRYNLEQSSGDARADQSIKTAASRVGTVPALPAKFIEKYRSTGVPVRFTVKPK